MLLSVKLCNLNSWLLCRRSALVPYAVQALNLDLAKIEARPEAQQIVVANLDEVKRYAF